MVEKLKVFIYKTLVAPWEGTTNLKIKFWQAGLGYAMNRLYPIYNSSVYSEQGISIVL